MNTAAGIQPPPGSRRDRHDHGLVHTGLVEHRQGIIRELPLVIGPRVRWPVGGAVATSVEGDDHVARRQVRNLIAPEIRMDDRPRRQQQDRLRSVTEDLVVKADSVASDDPFGSWD